MPEGEIVLGIESVLALLDATEDNEDSRLATRLRGVVDLIEPVGTFALEDQTPEGYPRIINVTNPHPDISDVAAVGDNSTDDNEALQNIFDWLKGARANAHVVWLPFLRANGASARYLTSKPLRAWTNTHLLGPATIKAHPSFDWVNHQYSDHANFKPVGNSTPGDIALLEMWNEATTRGAASRLFVDDITLDCAGQPGSIGVLWKCQQQGETRSFRVNNADIGMILWGQQSDHFNLQFDNCDIGLHLGGVVAGLNEGNFNNDAKFHTFYTLNVEKYMTGIVSDCTGPNWFHSLHFESSRDDPRTVFVCRKGPFVIGNGWGSHSDTAGVNHAFVIGDVDPIPAAHETHYKISNFRIGSSNATGQLMIDDKVRPNMTRIVGLQRYIEGVTGARQNDTQQDYDEIEGWYGDDGGFHRIGGLRGGTAAPLGRSGAQTTTQANIGQDEPMARWNDSGGTSRFKIEEGGSPVLPVYTDAGGGDPRPAANAVPAGTTIFNSDDGFTNVSNGANWLDPTGSVT